MYALIALYEYEEAATVGAMAGAKVDAMDVYGRGNVVGEAWREGVTGGMAMDLTTADEHGEPWDLSRAERRRAARGDNISCCSFHIAAWRVLISTPGPALLAITAVGSGAQRACARHWRRGRWHRHVHRGVGHALAQAGHQMG